MPLARLSSNKENAFAAHPLAVRKAKAGVLGLGIGLPTRRVKRSTSVQRAKAANSKPKVKVTKKTVAATSTASSAGYIKIPRSLARPHLPAVAELEIGNDVVPAAYIRDSLAKVASGLLLVGAMFRPFPSVRSGSAEGRKSFAFGIPPLVKGQVQDPAFLARIRGYEPDLCLALRKPGADLALELLPVHRLVYAAHCAYFPSLPLSSVVSTADEDEGLATIAEDLEADGGELAQTDLDDGASDVSDASAASEMLYVDSGPYRHLPLLGLEVPSPETWHLLHLRLHSSDAYQWQRSLLNLPAASTPAQAREMLSAMSNEQVQQRLSTVHGVWQNCCAVGVTIDSVWEQLGSAWAVVVDVLVSRASRNA